jgi:hypothetical protein
LTLAPMPMTMVRECPGGILLVEMQSYLSIAGRAKRPASAEGNRRIVSTLRER